MRIIRGILKSRRVTVPKKFPSRPTTDFAKEGLFNVLENRLALFDLEILDLCAGTGNITFEFLSREAGYVTAIDGNPYCVKHIRKLAQELGVHEQMDVLKVDVLQFLQTTDGGYDIIFADPPYDATFHGNILEIVKERSLLNENGLLIVEHGKYTPMAHLPGFEIEKVYGNVHFSFFTFEK